MARPTIMKIALVIALTMAAGSVYAGTAKITSVTSVGASSFTPSNNVQVGVNSDGAAYSANAKHLKGNRLIAFSSNDSKLYYSTSTAELVGVELTAPSAVTSYATMGAGWNSM